MALNDAGRMVETVWNEIPEHYPGVDIDAFVVMPNHVHGIVVLVGAAPRGRPTRSRQPQASGQPQGVARDEPWKVEDRGEKPAIALKGR
jgi:putative transposase